MQIVQCSSSPVKIHCSCISVERICGVWVGEELGQERLENVGEIIQRCPGLVDDVQTDRAGHLVYVGMIHLDSQQLGKVVCLEPPREAVIVRTNFHQFDTGGRK